MLMPILNPAANLVEELPTGGLLGQGEVKVVGDVASGDDQRVSRVDGVVVVDGGGGLGAGDDGGCGVQVTEGTGRVGFRFLGFRGHGVSFEFGNVAFCGIYFRGCRVWCQGVIFGFVFWDIWDLIGGVLRDVHYFFFVAGVC